MPEIDDIDETEPPPVTLEVGTIVEKGTSTSEFRVLITAMVSNTILLAVAFGAPLDERQQAAILAWVGSVTLVIATYIAGRSVRKIGR